MFDGARGTEAPAPAVARSEGDRAPAQQPGGVVVEDLVKRYRKNPIPAVDGVSFTVARGEIFGLLGPNGAGKTTTIGVLTTRVRPDGGRAFVGGIDVIGDPVAAKSRLAVVPQRNNLDRGLTIRQNLLFHAAYHGVPKREREGRATVLLQQFGLADRQNDKVEMFSGGQMQRVMIARALMHAPEVLFLDEPTTGLDPAARLFVWDRVQELQRAGVTIVLTTHDMDEAAALSDRVAIMDHGHLLALDTPDALTRELPGNESLDVTIVLPATTTADTVVQQLEALDGIERVEVVSTSGSDGAREARMRLYLSKDAVPMIATIDQFLSERRARLIDFRLGHHSLEDVFLHLTGRLLR
jgi:ABC-2 type transport system ATP-binding protein